MKRSELITRCKIQIPNLKETGLTDDEISTLLRQAVDQVNLLTKVYTDDTDFNIVAEQQTYNLSTIAPNYLGETKTPLFFKDSADEWQEVLPTTKAWIEENYPNYLNAESADLPIWYWIEGDELSFYPKPSTSYTNGARLNHLKKSGSMGSGDSYPFTGTTTEITAFIPLDDALIAYVRWKLTPAFGQVSDQDLREREFLNECRKGAKQVRRRPAVSLERSNHMRFA